MIFEELYVKSGYNDQSSSCFFLFSNASRFFILNNVLLGIGGMFGYNFVNAL